MTVNVHIPVLLDRSEAEQFTVVTPFWNVDPEAGTQDTGLDPSQLSVAVGVNVGAAVHTLGAVLVVIFVHPLNTGASWSATVIVNVHIPVFGVGEFKSEAEHVTVVTPLLKVVPEDGTQVTGREPSQLSVAVGAYVAVAVHTPGAVFRVWLVHPLITGAWLSFTVIVKVQEPVLAVGVFRSEAEQLTVVTPLLKVDPEAGTQVTGREPSQLSVAVGVNVAVAVHTPAAVLIVWLVHPLNVGA